MSDTVTYDKMDPAVKGRWLEALRSDKFKQGKFELLTEDGCNCCLGVLAEINSVPKQPYLNTRGEVGWTDFLFPDPNVEGEVIRFDSSVPTGYCGLSDPAINQLIGMNDDGNKTFPEIADFIEENL